MSLSFAGSLGPSKLNKLVSGEWPKISCETESWGDLRKEVQNELFNGKEITLDLAYDEREKVLHKAVLTVENLHQTPVFGNRIHYSFDVRLKEKYSIG